MPWWLFLAKGEAITLIPVRCLYCQSEQVIKGGKTDTGKQRYRCLNPACSHQSFLLDSAYKGRSPQQFPVIELERLRAYRQEPVESTGRRFSRPSRTGAGAPAQLAGVVRW